MRGAQPPRTPAPASSVGRTKLALELPDDLVEALAVRVAELLAARDHAPEPWIGVEQAAEHLACPRSRIYALASAGRIPHRKDSARLLFRRAELDDWLEQGGAKRP